MASNIYMDDVIDISLAAIELITTQLKEKHGVELSPTQEDQIYLPLRATLEEITNAGDYRGYN